MTRSTGGSNQPITDVVYGKDHPSKQPRRGGKKAPRREVTSLVGDLLPADIKQRLSALQWRLEKAERERKKS